MTTRTTTTTNNAVAIVAAGSSSRMGELGKKEYLPLNGGSVLSETALVFLQTKLFSTVLVVHPKNGLAAAKKAFYKNPLVAELSKDLNVIFTPGGDTRQESVFNALKALNKKPPVSQKSSQANDSPRLVLIHDGARPFISQSLVKKTLTAALKYGAAVPALQPVETQKEMDSSSKIARHLKRSSLAAVQTPQGFLFPEILECHKKAKKEGKTDFTDDTEIWDNYSDKKTRVIPGEPGNIKITYPKDFGAQTFRIGLGTDLHRLVEGRPLILGGVVLPYDKGEDGHSDGDALLHAAWKDVRAAGWELQNLDCVVKLQEPKFLPHRQKVRQSIARVLGVDVSQVFVKAKTGERVGPVGLCQAVETEAVCLLTKK